MYHRVREKGYRRDMEAWDAWTGLSVSATVTAVACALKFLEMQARNQEGTGLWTVDTAQ